MNRQDNHITPLRVDLQGIGFTDILVITLIVLGAVFGLMGAGPSPDSAPLSKRATVFQDGVQTDNLDLSQNREVPVANGTMVLEINNGRIRVKSSDCDRQFCVHQGWAAHNGETIICVPHKTVIDIEGNDHQPAVDAVIY